MAGMTPSDKTYLRASPFNLFKHRIGWLLLLMISATFTGMIITSFESALANLVVLTAFIPMLMDTGGNTGSQSSVTVIRSISLGELEFRDLAVVICCGAVTFTGKDTCRILYFSCQSMWEKKSTRAISAYMVMFWVMVVLPLVLVTRTTARSPFVSAISSVVCHCISTGRILYSLSMFHASSISGPSL